MPLRITATVRGEINDEFGSNPFEEQVTVDVVLDGDVAEVLTIDSFPSPVTTEPGRPYLLDLSSTAGDAQTGISAVALQVDSRPFVDVVDNGAGLWQWTQNAIELRAGRHILRHRVMRTPGRHRRVATRTGVERRFGW